MTITYFSITLNHHVAPVVDELYKLVGDNLTFVEVVNLSKTKDANKGSTEDLSKRAYLLRAWESKEKEHKAMELARTSDVALFCGYPSLKYQIERLKEDRLSFEESERWLKRGLIGMLSPRLLKVFFNYHLRNWRKRPLYRLCNSAFAAGDHYRIGMYKNKCFKWGYFTSVGSLKENTACGCEKIVETFSDVSTSEITPLMWCSRFLTWKHPELPILLAKKLKKKGYKFHLDMYGTGELENVSKKLAERLELIDCVSFQGEVPNHQLHEAMRKAEIFLFTSDRHEGWGAVANESMSEGCVLVASDVIGSVPYLVSDGFNGFTFHSSKVSCSFKNPDESALDTLSEKVEWLLDHPSERKQMQLNAVKQMQEVWSPANAAKSLLLLIDDLKNGRGTSIKEGPCSKARTYE